jgi:hypothetical protein
MLRRRNRAAASTGAYYRDAVRAWRRTIKWRLRLVTYSLALPSPLLLFIPHFGEFFCGLWIGAVLMLNVATWDEPPWLIENWRFGSYGERWTARELRKVKRHGWTARHDLDNGGYGNLDHVAIGPNGLFLIDSKHLHGRVEVEDGKLVCRHEASPRFEYQLDSQLERVETAAHFLEERLKEGLGWLPDVRAVIALWAEFSDEPVQIGKVTVVRGECLAEWLLRQSHRWTATDEAAIREAVAALPAAI